MQAIDWERFEVRGTGRNKRRYYNVPCACGRERWLQRSDALKATMCGICQRSQAGKLGYKAAMGGRRRGRAATHFANYLNSRPSKPEQIVETILYNLGCHWTPNYVLKTRKKVYWVDFLVNMPIPFAVEVNGEYWHNTKQQRKRDASKKCALRWRNIPLLTIWTKDIATAGETILKFMEDLGYERCNGNNASGRSVDGAQIVAQDAIGYQFAQAPTVALAGYPVPLRIQQPGSAGVYSGDIPF